MMRNLILSALEGKRVREMGFSPSCFPAILVKDDTVEPKGNFQLEFSAKR